VTRWSPLMLWIGFVFLACAGCEGGHRVAAARSWSPVRRGGFGGGLPAEPGNGSRTIARRRWDRGGPTRPTKREPTPHLRRPPRQPLALRSDLLRR